MVELEKYIQEAQNTIDNITESVVHKIVNDSTKEELIDFISGLYKSYEGQLSKINIEKEAIQLELTKAIKLLKIYKQRII